jgi:hypothetical protein
MKKEENSNGNARDNLPTPNIVTLLCVKSQSANPKVRSANHRLLPPKIQSICPKQMSAQP